MSALLLSWCWPSSEICWLLTVFIVVVERFASLESLASVRATCLEKAWHGHECGAGEGWAVGSRVGQRLSCGCGSSSFWYAWYTALSEASTEPSPHLLCCPEGMSQVSLTGWGFVFMWQGCLQRPNAAPLGGSPLNFLGPVQLSGHSFLWAWCSPTGLFSFSSPVPSLFYQHFIFRNSPQFLI